MNESKDKVYPETARSLAKDSYCVVLLLAHPQLVYCCDLISLIKENFISSDLANK